MDRGVHNMILVKYESGVRVGYKLVTLDYSGQMISVRNQKAKLQKTGDR